MSNNRSLGPIQVVDNSTLSINQAFRQLQEQMDYVRGLRGNVTINDRVGVSTPTATGDAVNLGLLSGYVQSGGKILYGSDYIEYEDTNDTVLHGFGNVPT